ncbi:MAG TPA: T9SS type A sorting domain-containing protein [Ignavibacteria bacterium]|nr:T9SS type A sorting domain-containing protein [Ignavibacteria bacterium]HMR40051.1 T9SS type A sorting domain-containing protein [Ignavibacteria bacterium]
MKKIILHVFTFMFIIGLFINNSYGQLTLASVEGFNYSRDLTYTNPVSNSTETRKVGLCFGKIGNPYTGADVCLYSYDITKAPDECFPNFDYIDDSTTTASAKTTYIVYNYYPGKNPGAGQLSNLNTETAAIQAAIWHYTNGLDVNTITHTNTKNRALAIIAATDLNGASWSVPAVLRIVPDFDPDYFYMQTYKDNGTGVAVNGISLSITQGTLNPNSVNTNSSGISPSVLVSNTTSGIITAIANMDLPKGTIFRNKTNMCPKLIMACPGPGTIKVTADWGALPVELASFTSSVSGRNVTLSWNTVSEISNRGFDIEKSAADNLWTKIGFVNGNGTTNTTSSYSYTDNNLTSGRFAYRLKQIDFNGNFEYFNLTGDAVIGVPESFKVAQNYPNPFNPSTKISYDLPADGKVSLKIFDISGKELFSLVDQYQTAGYYSVNFDGSNLSTGAYFYRVVTEGAEGNFIITKKMMLVK